MQNKSDEFCKFCIDVRLSEIFANRFTMLQLKELQVFEIYVHFELSEVPSVQVQCSTLHSLIVNRSYRVIVDNFCLI